MSVKSVVGVGICGWLELQEWVRYARTTLQLQKLEVTRQLKPRLDQASAKAEELYVVVASLWSEGS
jgi:hypothetical protein